MRQLLNTLFLLMLLLSASLSHACKEATLNENFPIKFFEPHDTIVLATVSAVTENTESRYGGFSTFTAIIQETIKGSTPKGAIISGKPAIEEHRAVCPTQLSIGSTYILLLNKQSNTFSLSRFSFPTNSTHIYYSRYVQEVKAGVNGR
jgi:hypothetical protein